MTHRPPLAARRIPALAAALSLAATPALGQAPPPRDTVRLPAIVVTATRLPSPREEVPNAVTLLDGAELERRGITRVVDALREVAGLTLVESGPPGAVTSLFVRGAESDHARVLVDGVPLNQPGGSINLADVTTDNVDRIEIVRGPTSTLYGSDAVAGVINIITRDGAGGGSLRAAVRATESGSAVTVSGGGGSPRFGYTASASRLEHPGTYKVNHRYRGWSAAGLVRATFARGDVRVSARHQDGVFRYPTDGLGFPADSNQFTTGALTLVGVDAGWSFSPRIGARVALSATSGVDRAENTPDSPGETDSYSNRTEFTRRAADVRVNARLAARTILTVGAAAEAQRFSNVIMFEGSFPGGDAVDTTRGSRGVYAQLVAPVGARVTVTTGARAEDNERFGRFATVRAGATYQASPLTTVRLSAGTGFKEPTFYENYGGGFSVGNPNLAPERSRSAELGVERRFAGGRGMVGATVFVQRFDSLVQYAFRAGPDSSDYFNVAGASARGLELELRAPLSGGLDVAAQWTWLCTAPRLAGSACAEAGARPLLRRPAHGGAMTLRQALSRGQLSLTARYVGRRDDLDFRNADPVTYAPARAVLPAYLRLDAAGAWRVVPSLRFTARVENALDKGYEEVLYYAARGRTVWIGMDVGSP